MTKQDLWAAYVAKNPAFARPGNVTMTSEGLFKLFSQTYDKAHDHGFANGKAAQKTIQEAAHKSDPFGFTR